MTEKDSRIALFPGAFDPVTHGHLDIIERAAKLYDRLVVAIGINPLKQTIFTPEERAEMLSAHTSPLNNVKVRTYEDLTVEFAKQVGAGVILRGIRDTVDLHNELQIANTNLIIGGIETMFLMTSHEHVLTSSSLIKQIVEIGGYDSNRIAKLVPLDVATKLEKRLRAAKSND